MPSYTTLVVIALAASSVSPAFSAPVRVTREQAFTRHELDNVKRGFKIFGFGSKVASKEAAKVGGDATAKVGGDATAKVGEDAAAKVGEDAATTAAVDDAAKVAKPSWGSKLGKLGLGLVVGLAGATAGTKIYESINPDSKALGATESSPSNAAAASDPNVGTPTNTGGNTGYYPATPSTSGGYYPTTPNTSGGYYPTTLGTSSGYSTTSNPSYSTTSNPSYSTTSNPSYSTTPGSGSTNTGYGSATSDPSSGGSVFSRSDSNLNSRTSPHKNLLSRNDLEKAIGLFTRMLDELD